MPTELAQGQLLLSEVDLTCEHPVPLAGRPDQVYLLANGRDAVIIDTKVRARPVVYHKDRVALGAYKVILENSAHQAMTSRRVKPYGYIRLVKNGRPRYKKVMLATEQEVVAIYYRREQIMAGQVTARRRPHGSPACRRCNYREVC